jgi:NADP-dependent 3-hydroxy acid dehydrogenase YdfG
MHSRVCAYVPMLKSSDGSEGVVIRGRREAKLEQTAAELRASGEGTKVLAVRADITVDMDMENLHKAIQATFGRPADVVLANAGWVAGNVKFGEDPVDNWWQVYLSGVPFRLGEMSLRY